MSVQRWGGEPGVCPQCGLKVYAAEEVMANGHKWHRLCLKCSHCNKLLSQGALCNHEDDIFCRPCHSKLFGPRGYGFAGGAAGLPTEAPPTGIAPLRQSACVNVNSQLATSVGNDSVIRKRATFSAEAHISSSSLKSATSLASKPLFGGAPRCRRCNAFVYAAERVIGGGHSYHKACFKCSACNRGLDSVTLCEREEELFCRTCYGKNFGPKGFGFGISSLHTEAPN